MNTTNNKKISRPRIELDWVPIASDENRVCNHLPTGVDLIGGSQKTLRTFIQHWLSKWPPETDEDRDLYKVIWDEKTKLRILTSSAGFGHPVSGDKLPPKCITHVFEADCAVGTYRFFVIEGLEPPMAAVGEK